MSAGATRRRRTALAAGAAAFAVLVAACGSSGSSSTTTLAATTSTTTSAQGGSTTTSAAMPAYAVTTGTVPHLGTVLVDGRGFTLYLFVPDHQSGTSSCSGACAQGWPPLVLPTGVATPIAGGEAKTSLLGTTKRSDGTTQVTYNKWPLYLWVGDSQPGQATGQGINNLGGLWYVLSPDGKEITTAP